jgi:hypothetical protein
MRTPQAHVGTDFPVLRAHRILDLVSEYRTARHCHVDLPNYAGVVRSYVMELNNPAGRGLPEHKLARNPDTHAPHTRREQAK